MKDNGYQAWSEAIAKFSEPCATGFEDRFGNEIFEGDKINTKLARYEVVYEEGEGFMCKRIMGGGPELMEIKDVVAAGGFIINR